MGREGLQKRRLVFIEIYLSRALVLSRIAAHEDTQLAIKAAIDHVQADIRAVEQSA